MIRARHLVAGLAALVHLSCAGPASRGGGGVDLEDSLRHDARQRSYLLHLPDSYDGTPAPLVVALHGGGGSGAGMARLTGLDDVSDREGFLVVYPEAVAGVWNDGRGVRKYESHREDVDDVGFVAALIARLTQRVSVDETRVYVTGMSNGAMMAHRLACELTQRLAAVAPVAGAMPRNVAARCEPAAAVSILMLNGTDDALVPWEGGHVRLGRQRLGEILSAPGTAALWASLNGCDARPRVDERPDRDPADGTRVHGHVYPGCRAGVAVALYEVRGGGHAWPGGWRYLPEFLIGKTSRDIDASEAIWRFFATRTR